MTVRLIEIKMSRSSRTTFFPSHVQTPNGEMATRVFGESINRWRRDRSSLFQRANDGHSIFTLNAFKKNGLRI